jgi:methylmalonyl-CoA/ethylmalonyl-CoA epimerase
MTALTLDGLAPQPEETRAPARLHHVGFVVASIPETASNMISTLGLTWDGQIFHDPVQTVRVTFLEQAGGAMLELVEPESAASRVAGFLKRGGGRHHLCYEVASLEPEIETCLAAGGILISQPAAAVAFAGRRIAWVCTRDRLLIEYLERGSPPRL